MSENFDFGEALNAVQAGQSIIGKDGVLGPLVKQLTEAALEGELDVDTNGTTDTALCTPSPALRPICFPYI